MLTCLAPHGIRTLHSSFKSKFTGNNGFALNRNLADDCSSRKRVGRKLIAAKMNLSDAVVAVASTSLALGFLAFALAGFSIAVQPTWMVRWLQEWVPNVVFIKNTKKHIVALTFDDGPHKGITEELLDILKENGCRATFFIIGSNMDNCPELVQRIVEGELHMRLKNIEMAKICFNRALDTLCKDCVSENLFIEYEIFENEEKKIMVFIHVTLFHITGDLRRSRTCTSKNHEHLQFLICNEVGNHTMYDVASWSLPLDVFEKQLLEVDDRLKNYYFTDAAQMPIKWFRPGHGFYTQKMIQVAQAHGYRTALGSLFPVDTLFSNMGKHIAKYLLWRIHDGAIIILHDREPQAKQTPEVLKNLLPQLKAWGYSVVTLSQLLELKG